MGRVLNPHARKFNFGASNDTHALQHPTLLSLHFRLNSNDLTPCKRIFFLAGASFLLKDYFFPSSILQREEIIVVCSQRFKKPGMRLDIRPKLRQQKARCLNTERKCRINFLKTFLKRVSG